MLCIFSNLSFSQLFFHSFLLVGFFALNFVTKAATFGDRSWLKINWPVMFLARHVSHAYNNSRKREIQNNRYKCSNLLSFQQNKERKVGNKFVNNLNLSTVKFVSPSDGNTNFAIGLSSTWFGNAHRMVEPITYNYF